MRKSSATIGLFLIAAIVLTPYAHAADANTMKNAIAIKPQAPASGEIKTPGDVNWFKFNATANSRWIVETYNFSLTMDSIITLYDNTSRILATDDDGGQEPLSSRIAYSFRDAGTYYVKVEHFDPELGTGKFSIILRPHPPPTLNLVFLDRQTSQPIRGVVVELYNASSIRLINKIVTTDNGLASIEVKTPAYYFVTVRAEGYHDIGGLIRMSATTLTTAPVGLTPVTYSGSVSSTALVTSPTSPGVENTLRLSIQNLNGTYPVLIDSLTIRFPWYGFYEGQWQGNVTVTKGMPVTIQPKGIWTYDYKFTPPTDSRAYLDPSTTSTFVDIHGQAKAFRLSISVNQRTGVVAVNTTLVTAKLDPEAQAAQGFRVPVRGITRAPVVDPTANSMLSDLSKKIGEVSSTLGKVSQGIDNSVSRLDDVNTGLRASNLKLDDISSNLNKVSSAATVTNSRLQDIGTQIGASNLKLDNMREQLGSLSSGISDANRRLGSIITGLDGTTTQLGEANTALKSVNNKLESTGTLLITDTVGLLIISAAILIVLILIANYLRRMYRRVIPM
ncbi:MAG: DVUA0089 family protein [Thaumarchaeota archaeon]|nr:DVUA0089 family protein [Nitrososphaerota archaeon]